MESKKKKLFHNKTMLVIAFNLAFILLGIGGLATGTMAWFASRTSFDTDVGSFSVVAPPSVEFDLFYLDHFEVEVDQLTVEKYGNYNKYDETHGKFAGYETSYPDASFSQIRFDNNGAVLNDPNPTLITDLWPAHKLTYAIVIKSGSVSKFSLDDWEEVQNPDTKILKDEEVLVSLTWAINLYGKAYSVLDGDEDGTIGTGEIAAKYGEATTGYRDQFDGLDDCFLNDEDTVVTNPKEKVTVVDSIPVNAANCYTVIFFTIEFSNDPDTYYSKSEEYWEKDEENGNSNCYELLRMNNLLFGIQ